MRINRKILTAMSVVMVALATICGTAVAHVVVKPGDVPTASFQTFSVSMPNERDTAVSALKLVLPEGLQSVSPTQKPGWHITEEKTGEGEAAKVTSITWDGGAIDPELRDDFTFSAKVPDTTTELVWKAYQTYADGTTVSWDQKPTAAANDDSKTAGPYSVTRVTVSAPTKTATTDTTPNNRAATLAVYIAAASFVISLIALGFATRQKNN